MNRSLRVLVADDHEAIRQGLRALFAETTGVEVVDDVADVETAMARVRDLAPDLFVTRFGDAEQGGPRGHSPADR